MNLLFPRFCLSPLPTSHPLSLAIFPLFFLKRLTSSSSSFLSILSSSLIFLLFAYFLIVFFFVSRSQRRRRRSLSYSCRERERGCSSQRTDGCECRQATFVFDLTFVRARSIERTPRVNFIKILQAAFAQISFLQKIINKLCKHTKCT